MNILGYQPGNHVLKLVREYSNRAACRCLFCEYYQDLLTLLSSSFHLQWNVYSGDTLETKVYSNVGVQVSLVVLGFVNN